MRACVRVLVCVCDSIQSASDAGEKPHKRLTFSKLSILIHMLQSLDKYEYSLQLQQGFFKFFCPKYIVLMHKG